MGRQDWSTRHNNSVAVTISALYELQRDDANFTSQSTKVLHSIQRSKRCLVASLPSAPSQPYRPLHIFYIILTELPGPWPSPRCLMTNFARLLLDVHSLPERRRSNPPSFMKRLEHIISLSCQSLSPFISRRSGDALFSPHDQVRLSHKEIHSQIDQFALPEKILKSNKVVTVLLDDTILQSTICLAAASSYIVAPGKPTDDLERLRSSLELTEASCIITSPAYAEKLTSVYSWLSKRRIKVVVATWTRSNKIRCTDWRGQELDFAKLPRPPLKNPNAASVLLLRPSWGGTEEIVEFALWELICEAFMTASICELGRADVGIAVTSANEVGGLPRGVLASLVSGSAMFCSTSERCDQFCELMQGVKPSWCLASKQNYRRILAGASLYYLSRKMEETSSLRYAFTADGPVPAGMACLIGDALGCEVVTKGQAFNAFGSVRNTGWTTQPINDCCNSNSPAKADRSCAARPTQLHPNNTDGLSNSRKLLLLDTKSCKSGKHERESSTQPHATSIRELNSPCQELEKNIMRCAENSESSIYDRIAKCVAFPVKKTCTGHSLAILLVPATGTPRVDLRAINDALRQSHGGTTQTPQLIVYINSFPQEDNDILRDLFANFLDIPALSDDATQPARHWEAVWPSQSHVFGHAIAATQCKLDQQHLRQEMLSIIPRNFDLHLEPDEKHGGFEAYLWPQEQEQEQKSKAMEKMEELAEYIKRLAALSLHAYMMPEKFHVLSKPLFLDKLGHVDSSQLRAAKAEIRKRGVPEHLRSIEDGVAAVFAGALSCEAAKIDLEASFFELGGDKTMTEALTAALRVEFNIEVPHALIRDEATVRAIADYIGDNYLKDQEEQHTSPYSSTRWWLLILQLVPLVTLYPARRAWQLTFQLWLLSRTKFWEDNDNLYGRIMNLLMSIYGSWASVQVIFPIIGILLKWIIIGRHKEGTYPMWGFYHTRWWLVQKIVSLCDLGFFDYCAYGKRLFFRLMGAKIGKGVALTDVQLGEWDLLDIREGASLSSCICRPFAVEKNSNFYLGRIVIGERSSIGALSIIAPGTEVLPDTYLGANSSSWEQGQLLPRQEVDESMPKKEDPHWLLFVGLTLPIYVLGEVIALLPWLGPQLAVLYARPEKSSTPLRVILNWYQGSPQVAFSYVAVMAQSLFSPWLFLLWAVLIHRLCRALAMRIPQNFASAKRQMENWKASIVKILFDASRFAEINTLLGQHHGARSGVLRLLGAKVGRQVSWPRSGPYIDNYELVDVGDNVTFGYDCHLFTSDEHGISKITIGNDSVIADQVCLLPGVEIGSETMLGFGTLTERGKKYDSGMSYFGRANGDVAESDSWGAGLWSVNGGFPRDVDASFGQTEQGNIDYRSDEQGVDPSTLEKGNASEFWRRRSSATEKSEQTHHYLNREARHHVFQPSTTLFISSFMTILTVFYWNVPAQSSMKLAARIFVEFLSHESTLIDPMVVYGLNLATTMALTTSFAIMAVAFVVLAKKILIGAFKPGVYSRESSTYFQRWQLLIAVEKIIRKCYVDKGILSLLTGTHWLVLYYRWLGAKIGKDCALFANGYPGLLITEADLIEIGDHVAIDDVGIISHVEMRGRTRLDKISIGDRCVLRSGSHILAGARMEDDSCLLEHTLIMPDQIVREGCSMYRRPAKQFYGNRKGSLPKA